MEDTCWGEKQPLGIMLKPGLQKLLVIGSRGQECRSYRVSLLEKFVLIDDTVEGHGFQLWDHIVYVGR